MTTQFCVVLAFASLACGATARAQSDGDELRHFLPQQFADKLPKGLAEQVMGPRKELHLFVNPRAFEGDGGAQPHDMGLAALPEHVRRALVKEDLGVPKGRALLRRRVEGFLQACLGATAVKSVARELRRELAVDGNKAFVACVDVAFQACTGEQVKLALSLRLVRLSLGEGRDTDGRAVVERAELLFADRHVTEFDVEAAASDDAVLAAYRNALMRCLRQGIAPALMSWRRMTEVSWLLACPGTITQSGLNHPASEHEPDAIKAPAEAKS